MQHRPAVLLVLLFLLFHHPTVAAINSLAAPKICRVTNFVLRRRAPPNTPPFLHSPSIYLKCHSLILDRHERPTTQEMLSILRVLPNTHIVALHLIGVPLTIEVVVNLAAYIANSKLQTIHLFDLDELDEGMISILSNAISANKKVTTIILANMYRNIGPVAGKAMVSMMGTTTANHIDVRGFKGGFWLVRAIQAGLRNGNVKSFNLRQIGLNTTGLLAVASVMPYSKVEHLDLSGNALQDEGATLVARRLLKSKTLQELDLSSNNIGDLGAGDLAVGLEFNEHLVHLNLENNPAISTDAVFEFSEILREAMFTVIVNIDLTKDQQRGPSTEDLKELNSLLEQNRNRIERPVPNRKHWPDEGTVSGPNRLMGIDGRDEFANRIEHAKRMNRFLATSGGTREL
jgi:hypothetical protein